MSLAYYITPSQVDNLLKCPRCLWLYFRENIKRPEGIFPSLPGGMDGLFKRYFDHWRNLGKLPPELAGRIPEKLFGDTEKLNVWRNNRAGIRFDFPEYDITLKGAIDELFVNQKDEFVLADFKTRGYPLKDDTHEYYLTQLNLYSLLFESNGYPVADYAYLLFFWPEKYENGAANFNLEIKKIPVNPAEAKNILKNVSEIIKGEKPAPAGDCAYCIYRGDKQGG